MAQIGGMDGISPSRLGLPLTGRFPHGRSHCHDFVAPEGFEPCYLPVMSRMLIPHELWGRCCAAGLEPACASRSTDDSVSHDLTPAHRPHFQGALSFTPYTTVDCFAERIERSSLRLKVGRITHICYLQSNHSYALFTLSLDSDPSISRRLFRLSRLITS